MRLLVLISLVLCSCAVWDDPKTFGGGWGLDLTFLPFIDGNVYQCEIDGANLDRCPDAVDGVCTREWCSDMSTRDLVHALVDDGWGYPIQCGPTPRHLGACTMICDADAPVIGGCNAVDGCLCRVED